MRQCSYAFLWNNKLQYVFQGSNFVNLKKNVVWLNYRQECILINKEFKLFVRNSFYALNRAQKHQPKWTTTLKRCLWDCKSIEILRENFLMKNTSITRRCCLHLPFLRYCDVIRFDIIHCILATCKLIVYLTLFINIINNALVYGWYLDKA